MRALGNFEFLSRSKFVSGLRALEHIPNELECYNAGKPLVLTGEKVSRDGAGKKFIKAFYDSKAVIGAMVDDIPSAPDAGLIGDLAKIYRERDCDSIIALGGGSIADAAKAVNILVSAKTGDLSGFKGEDKIPGPLAPFVFVSAGRLDGYEAARTAVIGGLRFSSDFLYPDVICIDPRICCGADAKSAANTAMVALTHAVEAIDGSRDNPVTECYGHTAMRLVYENISTALSNPSDSKGMMAMANASAMSGIAFSNSKAGIVHNLGRALSEASGAPEGACMGALLPSAIDRKMRTKEKLHEGILQALAGPDVYSATAPSERAEEFSRLLRQVIGKLSGVLPMSLKDLGCTGLMLKEAAAAAAKYDKKIPLKEYLDLLRSAGLETSVK